jgi:hypothetical protein
LNVQSYLEEHHVFSLDAFRGELGEGRTAYNLLVHAVKRGLVDRVMRGVYVSRTATRCDGCQGADPRAEATWT